MKHTGLIKHFPSKTTEQIRKERIEYLINQVLEPGYHYTLSTTKKGVPIFISTSNKSSFEVKIYDLEVKWIKSRRKALWLTAYMRTDHFFIKDIEGGRGEGHGEIAMNLLFDHIASINSATNNAIKYICGELSHSDRKYFAESQEAFYEKMGFFYDIPQMQVRKMVTQTSQSIGL